MKHSKLYTYLGTAGALLIPAIAVASLEDLNEFVKNTPVSASAMNDNFDRVAEAVGALEARVDTLGALEARVDTLEKSGLQAPIELGRYSAPLSDIVAVYQVHTDGVMTASAGGNGAAGTRVRFDFSPTEEGALNCDGSNCTPIVGRGFDGTTSSVFIPAGHYAALKIDQLLDDTAVKVLWQPLRGADPEGSGPTRIDSSHP